jgi:putative transposase
MAASDKFHTPTTRINEMWQTDFTYFKVIGWGWFFLSTVLDDYSRRILSWKLFTSMKAEDVQETLDMAIAETGTDQVIVKHRPRLLSDNGPCYISGELKEYLEEQKMDHTRGAPYHPQTQGKIERYHRSMKNVIKLDNYYLPGDLELEIAKWVKYYNNERLHESLDNVTPADMYFGRKEIILTQRQIIKQETLADRKRINLKSQRQVVLAN